MLEAASKTPTSPQANLTQLLAIRWLGEHKDRLGDSKQAVHTALQKLADGPESSLLRKRERFCVRTRGFKVEKSAPPVAGSSRQSFVKL